MRKILVLMLSLTTSMVTFGQSDNRGLIQSTQIPVNTYLINPAYTGAEEYTSFQASYRRNNVGLTQGPQTVYLSGHTRLQSEGKIDVKREVRKDTSDPTNFSLPTRGRSAERYRQMQAAKKDSSKILQMQDELDYQKRVADAKEQLKFRPYHGIGANLINEQFGGLARTGLGLSYAYHVFLTKKHRMSFGATVGVASNTIGDVTFRDQETVVPAGKITPDLNLGTYFYHDKYYIGISAMTLIPSAPYSPIVQSAGNNYKPAFLVTGGYKIALNEDLSVTPGVLVRYFMGSPNALSFDINARLNYKTLWAGLNFRKLDGAADASAMFGINLAKVFDISYSFDFNTGVINTVAPGGGHEIILGYRLQRKRGSLKSRLFN